MQLRDKTHPNPYYFSFLCIVFGCNSTSINQLIFSYFLLLSSHTITPPRTLKVIK